MVVATGNYGKLAFGYEDNFGSGGTATLDLGYGAKLSGNNISRNIKMLYNIGSPYAKKPIALQFDGNFGIDATLTNDNLFEAIFGSGSKEVITNDPTTTINVYTAQYDPKPFCIEYGYRGDQNILLKLHGCLMKSASISAKLNDAIRYKVSCVYKKPFKENPDSITPVDPPAAQDVFTFVNADLTFMGQQFVVQDFSVNLDLGANLLYGLGSAFAQEQYRGKIQISGSTTVVAQRDDVIDLVFSLGANIDSSEPIDDSHVDESNSATLTLNAQDGRQIIFDMQGVAINKLSQDLEAGELVVFSVDYVAMLASAQYSYPI